MEKLSLLAAKLKFILKTKSQTTKKCLDDNENTSGNKEIYSQAYDESASTLQAECSLNNNQKISLQLHIQCKELAEIKTKYENLNARLQSKENEICQKNEYIKEIKQMHDSLSSKYDTHYNSWELGSRYLKSLEEGISII